MIKSFSCTNIHSQNSNETIKFYNKKLGIPILSTFVNESDGVNLGFIKNAPTICILDANKWKMLLHGTVFLVFECDNLDDTCKQLKEKGLFLIRQLHMIGAQKNCK